MPTDTCCGGRRVQDHAAVGEELNKEWEEDLELNKEWQFSSPDSGDGGVSNE